MQAVDRKDADRLFLAMAAAVVIHAGLYFGVPAIIDFQAHEPKVYGPITVHIEPIPAAAPEVLSVQRPDLVEPQASIAVEPPEPAPAPKLTAVTPQPPPPQPAATQSSQPKPASTPASAASSKTAVKQPAPAVEPPSLKPRLTDRAAALTQAQTLKSSTGPQATKTPATEEGVPLPTRPAGTSAFRQAGEPTGVSAGAVDSSVVPGPEPTLPLAAQSPERTDPSAGQQRSGEAVAVGGSTASSPLDLGKLDQSLGATGSAGSTPSKPATAQTAATHSPASDIVWERPEAGKERYPIPPLAEPKLPAWVEKQGLTLAVKVAFTLAADGIVRDTRVTQTSGYTDVDKSVLDAVRRWRFNSVRDAAEIKGVVPYTIKPKPR